MREIKRHVKELGNIEPSTMMSHWQSKDSGKSTIQRGIGNEHSYIEQKSV